MNQFTAAILRRAFTVQEEFSNVLLKNVESFAKIKADAQVHLLFHFVRAEHSMKKEIILLFAVYCIAVLAARHIAWIDAGIAVLFLALILLARLCLFRSRRWMAVALVVCAGLGFVRTVNLNNTSHYIPSEFIDKTVYVEGVVQEITEDTDYCRYILQPEHMYVLTTEGTSVEAPVDFKISVLVRERYKARVPYACGDRILVRGKLEVPRGAENEGDFDYALWNKTNGVYATIKTDEAYTRCFGKANINWLYRTAYGVRQRASESFARYIGGDEGALLSGIVLSERKNISAELQTAIRKSGLSHICVASGMHVSMLCGFLLWLLSRLRVPRKISYVLCVLFVHFFALMLGNGASMQRAALMFDLGVLAYFTRGDEERVYTCLCAAFIMLLIQPLYLFSIGFLLSFASVFGILIFGEKLRSYFVRVLKWKPLASALAISLCAQAATMPILAAMFHELPIYAVLYNLLIPWLCAPLMLLSGVVLAVGSVFPLAGHWIGFVLRVLMLCVCKVIETVNVLPFSTVAVSMPNVLHCILYYAILFGIWMCVCKKNRYARLCQYTMAVCCIGLACISLIGSFYAKLHFINVGEGDSALLRMPYGLNVLIDGGGNEYQATSVGEKTLLPYLKSHGVQEIDYAIVSHYDTDHAEGVLYVCENMRVKNLILPYRHPSYSVENKTRLENCAAERNIRVHYMQGGDCMTMPGGLLLEALGPDKQMLERRLTENDLSLVLRVSYGETSMLFTGDIEKLAEKRLVTGDASLQAQILKVAHHGSDTSSAHPFLEKVGARYAVVSAGERKREQRALNALRRLGAEVYNTAEAGDVTFYFTRRGVSRVQ